MLAFIKNNAIFLYEELINTTSLILLVTSITECYVVAAHLVVISTSACK